VLVSAEFARHCAGALTPLGDFSLKGFAQRATAFGLPDERPENQKISTA
jgi:class 3 adenylate cyclase